MKRTTRSVTTITAVLLSTTLTAQAEGLDEVQKFNIEAQPLDAALIEFSEQAGLQLMVPTELVAGLQSPGINGEVSATAALASLLDDNDLTFQPVGDDTVALSKTDEDKTPGKSRPASSLVLMAQNQTSAERNQANRNSETTNDEDVVDLPLEEIVVTGSSIRGVYPESSPLQIFDAEDIARSGVATLEQFFARLPENHKSISVGNAGANADEQNLENVNGIDLRGLGIGSTLVLLNGRRMAPSSEGRSVDISLIPLAAIERVEVLTDGASATYGTDAVGGVVNFILKDDFSGSNTVLRYSGVTDGDLRETQVQQAFGRNWSTGRSLISYSFLDKTALQANDRPFIGIDTSLPATLTPDDRRHGLVANIRQEGPLNTEFFGDVLISSRETKSDNTTEFQNARFKNRVNQDHYFVNLGIAAPVSDSIGAELVSTYSDNRTDQFTETFVDAQPDTNFFSDQETSNFEIGAKIEGEVFRSRAGKTKFSLGGGYTKEDYRESRRSGSTLTERSTRYLFGELFFPVVGGDQDVPAIERLELSVAGRYTDYSDFGGKTSPKVGLLWSPTTNLKLRGTYGASFKAPFLSQLTLGAGSSFAIFSLAQFGFPDPFSSDGSSILFFVQGNKNPNLVPEEADTRTLGFDFSPASLSDFKISATYFDIEYTDRIAVGDPTGGFAALFTPDQFTDLFLIDPGIEFISRAIDDIDVSFNGSTADPNDPLSIAGVVNVALDNRIGNISFTNISGVDVQFSYDYELNSKGFINVGLRAAHILEYTDKRTANAPINVRINKLFSPADLRMVGYLGYSNTAWAAQLNVNFVDEYENPFGASGVEPIDRWTTVDLNLSRRFEGAESSLLSGLTVSASVQNLFDEDPPFVSSGGGAPGEGLLSPVGYDPANASPIGRFVSIELSKDW